MQAVVATTLPPSVIASVNTASLASVTSGDGFRACPAGCSSGRRKCGRGDVSGRQFSAQTAGTVRRLGRTNCCRLRGGEPAKSFAGRIGGCRRLGPPGTNGPESGLQKKTPTGNTDATLSAPAEVARATKPPLNDTGFRSAQRFIYSGHDRRGDDASRCSWEWIAAELRPQTLGSGGRGTSPRDSSDPLPSGPEPMGRAPQLRPCPGELSRRRLAQDGRPARRQPFLQQQRDLTPVADHLSSGSSARFGSRPRPCNIRCGFGVSFVRPSQPWPSSLDPSFFGL